MKKVLLILGAALFFSTANAQLLFEDDFNYSNGQLTNVSSGANVSGGNWTTVSGTGSPIAVSTGSLTYTGYASGGVGGKITIAGPTSSGEDVRRGFTDQLQTANTQLYSGLLLNVTSQTNLGTATSAGDYFLHYTNVAGTGGGFHSRVYIRANGTGFNLGLQVNTAVPTVWDATVYSLNTTYLLVVGYEIVTGTQNDVGRLWVNPTLGTTNPPTPNVEITLVGAATATEPDGIDAFGIRQGGTTPNAQIDAFRVGTTWSNGALPVQFKSFTATKANDAIAVKWTTASEVNNKGFEVQRSVNGAKFETIAFVKGAGNSNSVNNYSFVDADKNTGNVCYRIKQIDFDGKSELTKTACVTLETAKEAKTMFVTPNPFKGNLDVIYKSNVSGKAAIQLVDMLGKVHLQTAENVSLGENAIHLNTESLPEGIYFIRFDNGTTVETMRLVKR